MCLADQCLLYIQWLDPRSRSHCPTATAPIPLVEELWRSEALNRKYSVPLNKLNKCEIYDLSHLPPNWDNIDRYSGLEEHSEDDRNNSKTSNVNDKHNGPPKTEFAREPYHMKTRQKMTTSLRKSDRGNSCIVKYAESESHSSDSDYEPRSRPVRNSNVGLREPTQSRLRAQRLISASNAEKTSRYTFSTSNSQCKRQAVPTLPRNILLFQ